MKYVIEVSGIYVTSCNVQGDFDVSPILKNAKTWKTFNGAHTAMTRIRIVHTTGFKNATIWTVVDDLSRKLTFCDNQL